MKFFILIILLAGFIQTSFLPINLCLILIICRSFVAEEETNLLLGFLTGLFLGILSAENIGFWALVFLLTVKIVSLVKKMPVSSNALTILPTSFLIICVVSFAETVVFSQSLSLIKILLETAFSLPFYLLVRLWNERFVVESELKLRIKN